MKKSYLYIFLPVAFLFVVIGCQKETSRETGNIQNSANGSLLDSAGNCQSAVVNGRYKMDSLLTDSNYVLVNANFSNSGKFAITTDTVNGMWFNASGYTLGAGTTVLKLKGNGKPILPNTSNFVVSMNGANCSFAITVTSDGDYLPTSAGSFWSFQYLPKLNTGSGSIDSFLVSVIGAPIPYNVKNYYQYATSMLDTFYFAKDGAGSYYEFGTLDFDYTGIFDSTGFIEYPYLKDNLPVNSSWDSPEAAVKFGSFNGGVSKSGTAKVTFTIMGVNLSYTIAGQTLNNVIQVKREVYFKENGSLTYSKVLEGIATYAKGIGLIDQSITLSNTSTQSIPVLRWHIN